mmetsp:Transcript_32152/g.76770  ORF Transcript_32152/g.76770 Transcript_32152/m.76770 type:complete len:206 (-) Transcript_32152:22-639(-)
MMTTRRKAKTRKRRKTRTKESPAKGALPACPGKALFWYSWWWALVLFSGPSSTRWRRPSRPSRGASTRSRRWMRIRRFGQSPKRGKPTGSRCWPRNPARAAATARMLQRRRAVAAARGKRRPRPRRRKDRRAAEARGRRRHHGFQRPAARDRLLPLGRTGQGGQEPTKPPAEGRFNSPSHCLSTTRVLPQQKEGTIRAGPTTNGG